MDNVQHQNGLKTCDSGVNKAPFIGLMIPFVGTNRPHKLPFVGKKLPSVTNWHFNLGFTMVELMITLVVLGILSAIAAPSIRDAVLNNGLATETNDMLASLMFARSEAVKRSTPVVICKSLDPTATPPVCDSTAANPWTNGWFIYSDVNSNNAYEDGTDVVLRVGDGFSGANKKIKPSANIQNVIKYDRIGFLTVSGGGSFSFCDSRGVSKAKVIEISVTGRARIDRSTAPDCS